MQKIALNLDTLAVESFEIDGVELDRGTVMANQGTLNQSATARGLVLPHGLLPRNHHLLISDGSAKTCGAAPSVSRPAHCFGRDRSAYHRWRIGSAITPYHRPSPHHPFTPVHSVARRNAPVPVRAPLQLAGEGDQLALRPGAAGKGDGGGQVIAAEAVGEGDAGKPD